MQSDYLTLVLLIIAFGFIGLRTILWQYLLKLSELSKIYPYASLVQVLILFYAVVLFDEPVTSFNFIGFFMMLSGVYFMSRDGR